MNKKIVVAILLLCAALSMGCLEEKQTYVQEMNEKYDEQETIEEPIEISTPKPMSDQPVAKYDFEWYTTNYIGEYFEAPIGYNYAVVTYRIKNDGYNTIYTNPHFWNFEANNVIYSYDSTSHSDEINTITVDIHHNGDVTNKIVFLIPDNINSGRLRYDPLYGDFTIYRYDSLIDNTQIVYLTIEDLEKIDIKSDELDNITISDVDSDAYWFFLSLKDEKEKYDKLINILDKPLNDETFLEWFDLKKKYYGRCSIDSEEDIIESLDQLDKFKLENEEYIKLRDEFRNYLEHAKGMDDRERVLLCSDEVTGAERTLKKLWKYCTITRRYI